jgi:type II secretory pathway pseudopilin PulG
MSTTTSEKGFTLLETMVALGVLAAGVLGVAAIITTGMQNLTTSPADVIVRQKAAQAIEAVFSARDSHRLTWTQIRNVYGASGSDGGVFLDGPQSLHQPGPDGLVNTSDDLTAIETMTNPGFDQLFGTADDQIVTLSSYQREISIRDVPGENGNLRSITVTMTYRTGSALRTYTLSSFISSYS